jgi:hypothetical protein
MHPATIRLATKGRHLPQTAFISPCLHPGGSLGPGVCHIIIPGASLVPRAQVVHLKLKGLRLVNVTLWVPGLDIQVVDRVGMESFGSLAGEDVRETGRVGETEDAPSNAC